MSLRVAARFRIGLRGPSRALVQLLAAAILISGGLVIAVEVMRSAPAAAQSNLPTIAIKAPTTRLTNSSVAPTADEGATLTWTVTRTGSTSSELTVPLEWRDRGAGDYNSFFEFTEENVQVMSVTFPVGVSEVTLSVVTDDDELWERNTVLMICVAVLNNDGDGLNYQSPYWFDCAGFSLIDDDDPPLVTIAPNQATISEGGRASFTLTRHTNDLSRFERVWVTHQRVDSEGNVTNYSLSESLTFQADQASRTHYVRLRDNDTRSDDDFFTLRVTIISPGPEPGAPGGTYRLVEATRRADVAVEDDDLPRVSVTAPATQSEGEPVVFSFTRIDAKMESLTIDLSFTQGGDYLPATVPTTLTFEQNALAKQLRLHVDDGVDEFDGGVILRLSSTDRYTIEEESQSTTVLLTDDDEPQIVTLAPEGVSVVEGEDATFTLTRYFNTGSNLADTGQAMEWPLVVNVTVTEEGNFIDGTVPNSITFAPNSSTAILAVPTVDDVGSRHSANQFHSAYENDGAITATVVSGENYTAGLPPTSRIDPADAATSATLIVQDNEPPLVRASALQGEAYSTVSNQISVTEGVRLPVYLQRYFDDNSSSLTVRLQNTSLTCHGSGQPDQMSRELAPAESPFGEEADLTFTAQFAPGQDSTVALISTRQDNASECDIRWSVDILPPHEPVGATLDEWLERYNEWNYHPLRPNSVTVTMSDNDDPPIITFTSSTVNEDDGQARVVARLRTEAITSGYESSWPITLHWWTIPQTASETLDFTKIDSESVIFPADADGGASEQLLTIPIIDNHTPEATETLQIGYRLSTFFSDDLSLTLQGAVPTVTIVDNDQIPTVAVDSTTEVRESAGAVAVPITLDQPSDAAVIVEWATEDGSAKSGTPPLDDDYVAATGSYTFAPGSTIGHILVEIVDDPYDESAVERFSVRLTSATNGEIGQALTSVAIIDNDRLAYVVLSGITNGVHEGEGTAEFGIVLLNEAFQPTVSGKEVSLTFAVADGRPLQQLDAANRGTDYSVPSAAVTIPAGSSSASFVLDIIDDDIDEDREYFAVSITNIENARQLPNIPLRTFSYIRDNDLPPGVSIEDGLVHEPSSETGSTELQLAVLLERASGKRITVDYSTRDNTAKSRAESRNHDDDYTATMGTVTFEPGNTRAMVNIEIKGDAFAELEETFSVGLSSPTNVTIVDDTGIATIQDASRLPIIVVEAISPDDRVWENAVDVRIFFSLNHPDDTGLIVSGRETTFNYKIVEYTPAPGSNEREAIRGTDYLLPAIGSITFAPGETMVQLHIAIVNDTLDEPIERLTIHFDSTVNATFSGSASRTIAILDDDATPRIDVLDARVREDLGPMRFDVILATASSRDVSFDYNTQMGTAFEEEDYTYALGKVTIPAGATAATIEVKIINDGEPEGIEERFTLFLRNAVNGILVHTEPVGYIIDDDRSLPPGQQGAIVVSPIEIEVDEGDANGSSTTVSLSSQPAGTVVVRVNGTAGTDLAHSPKNLTFNDITWNDPQTLTFTASEDDDADDEYVPLFLVADGGGYTGSLRGILVTVDDDETAEIVVSPSSLSVDENDSASISVALASQPTGEVKVEITKDSAVASDLSSIQLGARTLTFTALNWQTAQTVSVAAINDDDASDETINLVLQGSGTGYAGLTKSIMVTTNDDDTIGLLLKNREGANLGDAPALTLTERESAYITVELATQPTDEVTVDISVTRFTELAVDTDGTPGTKTLTFDAQDWNVPKGLELISIGDDNSLDGTPVPVTFSTDGGGYQDLVVPRLNVAISDADSAALAIGTNSLVVFEDDANGTSYSVKLAAQPVGVPSGVGYVTVTVTAGAGSALTVRPTQLTFTGSDWNVSQTIVVTAMDDDDAEDHTTNLVHSATGAAEYAGVSADVRVSIRDDDERTLVIIPSSLSVDEGETASYLVRLATEPTGDVGVVISGHNGTDFSLDSSSLSFSNSNWSTPQNVRIAATDDDDGQPDVVTLIHTASGSDYGGVTGRVTVITIEDEQEAMVVDTTRISLAEGADATFAVALASRPSTAVTIELSAPQKSGLVFDKTSLAFSASDWRAAQTVTVTSSQDDDAADEDVEVRLEVGSGSYGAAAVVLQVAVVDDDSVNIVLNEDRLSVVEGSRTTYSVRLATQPSETATVDIDVPAGADILVLPHQLSFNADSWMTEQTVTIVARHDPDADVDPAITVTHTARNGDYDMATKTLTVVVLDPDVKGLVFVDSDGDAVDASESLDVDEGGTMSYGVRLASQPSVQVVVTLSPGGVGLSADGRSLTFTSWDWFRAQTVTVAASHDDDTSDGVAVITHTVAEGGYGPVRRSLEFVIADDDTAAIVLTDSNGMTLATDGLTVTEGATASYGVQLATEPSSAVTVAMSGMANTDLMTDETSLTFTSMNWNTPQTVQVSAGHDDDAVADAEVTLSHSASGGEYDSVMADLAVVIFEDDSDGFIVTDAAGDPLPGDILIVNEGGSAAYKISLSTEPVGPVTVVLTGTANTDLQLDKTEVTFTATNWSTPQTVTATAAHDDDAVNEPVAVVHTPSGAGYAAPAFNLNAVIDDDDHQSVMVSVESLDILEGGTTSVSVSLGTKPIGDVVVDLILSPGADLELPVAQLTFTAQNWMTAQNVSVVSQHDDDASDDAAQIGFNASGGDYNNVLTILPAIIRDDDEPGIVLSEDSLEVMEGSTADFTVRLATQPSQTVTVTIGGSAGTSLTLSSARLVFTSTDWSTPQTVTATAADDDDIDDETIEVSLAARDGGYDTATASLTVTVVDDDPVVEVSFARSSYSVGEGLSVSVSVSLSAVPGRAVVVPVTAARRGGAAAADYSGVPESVSFAADETLKSFAFSAVQDSDDDDGESVALGFGSPLPAGVSAGSVAVAVVSITDDDFPVVEVSFARSSYSVGEGLSVSVSVSLSAVPGRAVVVPVTAARRGGAAAADYSGVPESVSFAADETLKSFAFSAVQDSDDDDGESVALGFGSPLPAGVSAGSVAVAVVSITDDDFPVVEVSFARSSYSVGEGLSVSVSVSLSAVPGRAVVVPVTAARRGGAAAADYSGVPESVSFAADETLKSFAFSAVQDSDDDDGESVALGFGSPLPAGVSAGSVAVAVVSITDDDFPVVEVSFARSSYSVGEGLSVSVSVSLSAVPGRAVVVPVTAARRGGAAAADYSGVPESVSFAADETLKSFAFSAVQDSDDDDGESVALGFGSPLPAGVSAGSVAVAVVSITDDDFPVVEVSFARSSYSVGEGLSVSVSVSLSAVPGRAVVVPVTAARRGGAAAADYSGVPESVSFAADETLKSFAFSAVQDSDDDDGESVALGFGSPLPAGVSAGSVAVAVVSITDDDFPVVEVSFARSSYSVGEGLSVSVSVSLSAVPGRAVVVPVTAARRGGAAAADYSGVPESVSFAADETLKSFAFSAVQDSDDDDGESVALGFGSPLPAGVSAGSVAVAVVSITDDDFPVVEVSFARSSYSVGEGLSVSVSVSLSAVPGRAVVVPVTAARRGGAAAADYSGVPESVSFAADETLKSFAFSAVQDSDDDDGESVALGFGSPLPAGVSAGSVAVAVVSITDDDFPVVEVSFARSSYSVGEGLSVSVSVSLSAVPGRAVVVPVTAARRGGAVAADYSGVPESVSFAADETLKSFAFSAVQDSDDDDGESVALGFGSPLPAGVSAGSVAVAVVSITDDDFPVVEVSFARSSYSVGEGLSVSVSVSLSAVPGRAVAVPIVVVSTVGATSGDYTVMPMSVSFAASETSKTLTFSAAGDGDDDDDESVVLGFDVSGLAGVSTGSPAETTVSIDDDAADVPDVSVRFGSGAYSVAEGASVSVTVTLSEAPERVLAVPIVVVSTVGATSGDYTVMPMSVSFAASETSKTLTFSAAGDGDDDDDESVVLGFDVSGLAGVSTGSPAETTVSIDDDAADVPDVSVRFGSGAYSVAEGASVSVTVTLSEAPERVLAVPIVVVSTVGATSGDYTVMPMSVSFAASETSKTLTFSAAGDGDDDDDESVVLGFDVSGLAGVSTGSPAETTVSIDDDAADVPDVSVRFGSGAYSVAEGASVSVTVTLSEAPERVLAVPIVVVSTVGATSGDYTVMPMSVSFAASETSKTLTFSAAGDGDDDDDESVVLGFDVSGLAGVSTGSPAETTVSIDDDAADVPDVSVRFGSGAYSVAEGASVSVTVTLSEAPERVLAVPIVVVSTVGATSGDYTVMPMSVSFAASETSKTLTFSAAGDGDDDDDESVVLGFDVSGLAGVSTGSPAETTVSIDDDAADVPDVSVRFGSGAYSVAEGASVSVTVTLSEAPERVLAVPIVVVSTVGATSGDYTVMPMSVSFAASETSKTLTFSAAGDGDDDDDESVVLGFDVSGLAGVSTGSPAETTVSIDDDAADVPDVSVRFGSGAYSVAEGASVSVTVTLSEAPERVLAVPIVVVSTVGATSGDYTVMPMSVSFAASETSKTLTFSAAGDGDDDDDESVVLGFDVSGLAGVSTGSPAETTVSIDDDAADVPDVSVRFGSGAYSVAEGASVSVTVTLSEAPERVLAVPIVVVSTVGATSGDYTVMPMSVSFAASETSKTLTFSAAGDGDDDDDESVVLGFDVSGLAGVSTGSPAETTVSIDDDAADVPDVSVRFGSGAYSVAEGASVSVTVTLSEAPERVLAVPIVVVSTVGATSGDYTVMPMSVSFAASETSKTLTFSAAGDGDDDDDESVVLGFDVSGLAGVSTGSPAETTVSIDDDAADVPDVSVRFGSGAYSVAEGASVSVTVTLSEAPERVLAVPIVVVSTVGATSGDYTVMPMSVSFAASETSKTLTFSAAGDGDDDDDESVVLGFDVSGLAGVSTGSPAETTVSIDDDAADVPDVSVRFGSGAYSVAEGASVSVTVTLSEAPERVLAVPIVVVSTVGATSGDYTVMPMSVSFAASETSKTLTFSAAGDGDDDDDESVVLGFDVSGLAGVSTGSPAETTVSIDDDAADVPDVSVRFGSGAYSVAEGASVSVTVTLSEAPERVLAVPIVVVSTVGATSGDYTVMPMSVSFAASETSKTLTFSAAGDGDDDDDESVVLGFDVSGLAGVSTGSPAETTVSIDDDAADVPDVSVRFGSGAYSVAEGASVSVTVTLSEAPERVLAVPIVVVSTVGATSGDYTVMPMSVSFAASETSKTLTFSAAGDGDDDDDESVVLGFDVSGLAGVSTGSPAETTVSIDDDAADVPDVSVRFGSGAYSVAEGASVSVTVTLSEAPERVLAVPIVVVSTVGATSGDYTVMPMSVSFAASETSKTLTFSAAGDGDDDDDESVVLGFDVSGLAGVSTGSPAETTVSIDDDAADVPDVSVRFGSGAYSVAEGASVSVTVTLSEAPERVLAVPIVVVSTVGATSGDYTVMPMSVSFAASETSKTLTFSAAGDGDDDDDESVVLGFDVSGLAGVSTGSPAETTVSIDDDAADVPDVSVRFGSGAYSVAEGASVSVTVTLSEAPERVLAVPIVVVSTVGATSGDYTVMPMSVSFAASETSKTLTFSAAGDGDDDDDESVVLGFDVSGLAGVSTGSPAETTVSIDDDAADVPDVSVRFGSGAYSVAEGASVSVTVTLSEAPERVLAVPIVVVSTVGATSGDYTVMPMSVSFAASETSKTLTFSAAGDGDDDDDESVVLGFDVSGLAGVSTGSPAETTVSIDDDAADVPDVSVRFGSGAYSVAEGASVSVTVTLSEAPERVLAVPIVVVSTVGATSGDYTVMPMSVSFAASETSKTLTFSAAGDGDDDDDESVVLGFDVSGLAGVSTGSPAETTVSIDDDAADVPDVSVRFGSGAYSVAEGASVSVTVTLSEAPERVLAVPIVVVSTVGATSGDYTVMPMSVSFAASETSKTLTFSAAGDGDDDDDESVVLGFDVSGLAGVSTGSPAETTVSIDDDAADVPDVSVRFGSGAYSVAEGASVSVTVTLSEAPERVLAVPIVVVSTVGATSGDYTVMPMSVSFAASETSKTLTFSAAGDGDDDDDESVVLGFDVSGLAGVSTGSPAETTVSIDDDAADVPDVSVRFGSGAYSVAEGASVSVTVTLSEAPERVLAVPIVVVSTVGATSGDYTVMPMSVSFAASETSKTLTFSAAGDGDDDDDESVVLGFDVSGLAGVSTGSPAETTVSIDDDAADVPDVSVRFGSGAYSVAEGASVSVTVTLSEAPERVLAVPIVVVSTVGATSGDYTVMPMSVSFAASETSKTLTFSAAGDGDDDDDESVVLGFDVSGLAGVSTGSPAETTVSIDDDAADVPDVSVRFGSGAYSVAEGASVSVTVTLSEAPERVLAVPIVVVSTVGATSGDYTVMPMSVSFAASETSKTLTFSAAGDGDDDDDESVVLGFDVSGLAGVSTGSPAETTVSIDDDAADVPDVSVRFGSGAYSVAEGASVSVTVTLSEAPERVLAVPIVVVSTVGATSGDYTVMPMSVSFAASETSKTLTFSAAGDGDDDDDESVVLGFDVSGLAGVSTGSPAETTVSIDDDAADVPDVSVRFGSGAYSVAEGASVSVTVTLSEAPERVLAVPIVVVSTVGATSGDYTVMPMSVSFAASETSKTLTFSAAGDGDDDDDESVVLGFDVSGLAGVSTGSPAETTVSIDDDAADVPDIRGGTVVTIARVPDGTVIPDNSSLTVGETVEDGSTFIEGTRALFRLQFEAVGGGPPTGGGVDVEVSYFWHHESPLLSPHGQPTRGLWSLPLVDSWDTEVHIPDNDVGHPDGTATIRITGCWRNGCIIGTPSEITLTIVDDDGGPEAAPPGPPRQPRLACASSGDGYDDTAIAVSWNAPDFVGGAPVESYELRYRETTEFVQNRQVLHEWEYWPDSVAATSTILTGLVAGVHYTVQVRAVNGNGPGLWSESDYHRVGQPDWKCDVIDQLTPVGVVAGQAAFRYSLMSPPQRAVFTTWRCLSGWSEGSVATGGSWSSERWGRCVL